jgi:ABC-2 type transport system permease protein
MMTEAGEKSDTKFISMAAAYIMGFLMYMTILIYGVMVMHGVLEEKTNRIVELMISSVTPFQMLMGKIIGIALVGFTQFSIWIILFIIAMTLTGGPMRDQLSQIPDASLVGATQDKDLQQMMLFMHNLHAINFGFLFAMFFISSAVILCTPHCMRPLLLPATIRAMYNPCPYR